MTKEPSSRRKRRWIWGLAGVALLVGASSLAGYWISGSAPSPSARTTVRSGDEIAGATHTLNVRILPGGFILRDPRIVAEVASTFRRWTEGSRPSSG